MMRVRPTRTHVCVAVAATVVAALPIVAGSSAAAAESIAASATGGSSTEQRFVPNVVGAFNGLSQRADALGFRRGDSPEAGLCRHYQGLARKNGPDGTPYLFLTKSGNQPLAVCPGDDEHGYLMVIRMGSRDKSGERLRRNLYPYDGPTIPAGDEVVTTIALDGTGGQPGYRHPGGMQIVDDVLAIGAENRVFASHARAAILFYDVSDPANPRFIKQFDPPGLEGAANWGFGADPVGLTAVKTPSGACCRYLMVVAGGPSPDSLIDLANADLRFYRSEANNPDGDTSNLKSDDLQWTEVRRYTEAQIESCLGADWPTGTPTQHQMLNFVREGDLDGKLFLVGGWRDGSVVNPLADEDEFLDLYEVHVTPDGIPDASCALTNQGRKRVGLDGIGPALQSWGEFRDIGSFAAGSSAYVSPTGELIIYVSDHRTTLFGEYRLHSLVRAGSPTLRPTASVDGPFVVDEGSSVGLTGSGEPAVTKAFVQLFEDTRVGTQLTDAAWLSVEYVDRDLDHFDDLCKLNLGNNSVFDPCGDVFPDPLWDKVSSLRWFAPPGCTIQTNDYPIRSDEFPGPRAVILRGTGQFEEAHDLSMLRVHVPPSGTQPPWPVSPPPAGQSGADYDFDNDIEGVTFYEAFRVDGALRREHRCDAYYNAAIGLGWDLDDNGSFETSGSPVSFSAANLDGPSTATVRARATHPTDTSATGTGASIPVPIEIRNVAPQLVSSAVTDSVGNAVGSGGAPAIAGLPVTLDVTFTDPGLADTHTASVAWGDGTVDTSFDSFSPATSGAVGRLRDAHAFAAPGTYDIVATITDDDGGASQTTLQVEVLSLADAIEGVADRLTDLIAQASSPGIASALLSARDELIGNQGGQATNGALDKLEADDPVSAITKLRAAISDLALAESRGAGDLSALKDLLGLVAEGIATAEFYSAEAAVAPPSPGEERELTRIRDLIGQGHEELASGAYLAACDRFRQATEKALELSK